MFQILLLLGFIIPAIFFLITQERTLLAIQPANRLMGPGMVWLQLIPGFGLVWQFVVVRKISFSISKEMEFVKDDSILGISAQTVGKQNKRPTLAIGIIYCSLISIGIVLNLSRRFAPGVPMPGPLFSLSGMICWIIYWINLFGYKSKLKQMAVSNR